MDNENKNALSVEESDTDKAMQSFLTGSNDYESEKKVDEAPTGIKLGKFEGFIAALAVFAAALWTISNYGAALICAFAVLLTVITKPGKDTVHTVAANGLALGLMIVIRATLCRNPKISKCGILLYAAASGLIYTSNPTAASRNGRKTTDA